MMYLYGNRKKKPIALTEIFPQGENRQQVGSAFRQIEIKPGKACPWDIGDVKHIVRHIGLRRNSRHCPVLLNIVIIVLQKSPIIRIKLRPKAGKGFCFLMKNCIVWVHDIKTPIRPSSSIEVRNSSCRLTSAADTEWFPL